MFRSLFTELSQAGSGFPGRGARRAAARAATLAVLTMLALGALSGTARAESVFTDLRLNHVMQSVPWVGGGDADITFESDRFTDVSVQTGSPYVYPDGLSGYIPVLYEIKEVASNYAVLTVLRRVDIVRFYPPPGYRIVSTGINRVPAYFYHRYSSQDIFWHTESAAVEGTYLQSLYIRFNGWGRDDQGNATLEAEIWIGVELAKL
jgi:hypothetical protein